ncbi:MAG: hypothetical protein CL942_12980 [Desulfovibrio sp.]|nr:hypothetical protein [Desulfovibrio sp.]
MKKLIVMICLVGLLFGCAVKEPSMKAQAENARSRAYGEKVEDQKTLGLADVDNFELLMLGLDAILLGTGNMDTTGFSLSDME